MKHGDKLLEDIRKGQAPITNAEVKKQLADIEWRLRPLETGRSDALAMADLEKVIGNLQVRVEILEIAVSEQSVNVKLLTESVIFLMREHLGKK